MKFWFWFPWAIGALVAAVFVAFFFIGLADGSVSSFNAGLWAMVLLALGAIIGGSLWLRKAGHGKAAAALAWVLAVPGLFAILFMVLLVVLQPRWN